MVVDFGSLNALCETSKYMALGWVWVGVGHKRLWFFKCHKRRSIWYLVGLGLVSFTRDFSSVNSELYAYIIVCTNLARSPACIYGLQYSLRPYGNLGSAAAPGRHASARSMLVQRLKQPGPHGKPTSRGQSVRGNRWPEQRYQSPPAARLDHDHRGGSEKNASEQLSAIPRRRTMRRQNWRFRPIQPSWWHSKGCGGASG